MIEKLPTLYKRASTGKVQLWFLEIEGDKLRASTGQQGGKLNVARQWTVCKPKNVGRSNATTGEEQAQIEAKAQYKKKLAQGGYHESVDNIDDEPAFFSPMLATDIEKAPITPQDWMGPVYSSRKLDGMRAIVDKDGIWTREGKPILAVPHISEALEAFFREYPEAILDGELYNHEFHDNFNKLLSLCKKQKPTSAQLAESRAKIQYHIFDYPSVYAPFGTRFRTLNDHLTGGLVDGEFIRIVQNVLVYNEEEQQELYAEYLAEGYEGQMIRVGDAFYERKKRTKALKKVKNFQETELVVKSIEEGEGNRRGMAGAIIYYLEDGRTTKSGIKGGEEFYREIFENQDKYIGGEGTVRFQNYTPDGKPRLPVTIALYPEGRHT